MNNVRTTHKDWIEQGTQHNEETAENQTEREASVPDDTVMSV